MTTPSSSSSSPSYLSDGQTGSGKTFTMEGHTSDLGVSPRAVSELFVIVEKLKRDWSYVLTFSMLEIYNETILDLLDNHANKVSYLSLIKFKGLFYLFIHYKN